MKWQKNKKKQQKKTKKNKTKKPWFEHATYRHRVSTWVNAIYGG